MMEIHGLQIPSNLAEICNPNHLALLIYDMQVGIVSQIENGELITARIGALLAAARAARIRTYFTRHMSLPRELMGAFQFRMAMAWQRVAEPGRVEPSFLRDSPSFPIVPELTPIASEAIFDKLAMSAFEGTPLQMALRDCGVTAIAVAGIAMEVGIEPTVRHAADLGIIPVVIADACGAGHADAARRSLESLMFEGNSIITDVASFIDVLRRHES
jgi:nicotinamidase-related amidase